MTSTELEEPLVESARRAPQLAATLCSASCDWYHGLWPSLRVLEVAASPDRHRHFFLAAIGSAAATGSFPKVLVSGSADFSMLAHVVRAYRSHGAAVGVTVLDRCATPLALCRWYGELAGAAVDTVTSDVLRFAPADAFDLVCTHSFLSQFAPGERPELMTAWRDVLRPGGRVVTTTRINPPDTPDLLTFTPEQVDAFCTQVLKKEAHKRGLLDQTPEELATAARVYAERLALHATRSVDEVRELFEIGGFSLEHLEVRTLPGSVPGRSGPGTSQAASYAEIVAVRV